MAAIRDSFAGSADWTSTVEGAVRGELERRRRWLRLYMALLVALMAATLALLVLGVTEVAGMQRAIAPTVAATQRLEASTAALGQGQAALEQRLGQAEAALEELAADVRAQAEAAPPAAAAAETSKPAPRRRTPSRVDRKLAELDQRLQHVEAAASAAEVERAYLSGQVLRLDRAVTRLGATAGPQSAP